jgi:hypothetical protein
MASWAFILTDHNYVPQGEILNATARKVALPLSKLTTASFQVRLDNPLAQQLMLTSGYIKCYRKAGAQPWTLRHVGPIISSEATGDKNNATIAVNSVGSGWELQKRQAGKSATGTIFSTATDRAQIWKSLIDTTNGDGETGVSTAGGTIGAASAITYTAGPYKSVYDCGVEVATAFDGFDWFLDPVDNFASGVVTGTKLSSLRAAPVLGAQRAEAIFEWGSGRNNIAQYTWTVDRSTMANKVFHNTTNGPDAPGFPTVSAIDASSIGTWGLLEDLANADLLDQGMRQNLVNEHVKVRKQPKQVIQFTPHIDPYDSGRAPRSAATFSSTLVSASME